MKKILGFLLNKYLIATVAFVVWMIFFDSNSISNRMKLKGKLNELNTEKKFYLDQIRQDSVLTQKLLTDSAELERFAREKFLMKRDNEDVYILTDTSTSKSTATTTADRHQ